MRDKLSDMYKNGYKIGYMTAIHNVKNTGDHELADKLLKEYNEYPTIEFIKELEAKNS